jgi:hypothetical protein
MERTRCGAGFYHGSRSQEDEGAELEAAGTVCRDGLVNTLPGLLDNLVDALPVPTIQVTQ